MTPPPGLLVHLYGLGGWSGEYRRFPHQTQEGGRTGRQPQAGREPGPCIPAEGDANCAEGRDEPRRFACVRGDELWQAFREDATRTAHMATHKLPYDQLQTDGERAPREVCQAAWVAAMN